MTLVTLGFWEVMKDLKEMLSRCQISCLRGLCGTRQRYYILVSTHKSCHPLDRDETLEITIIVQNTTFCITLCTGYLH